MNASISSGEKLEEFSEQPSERPLIRSVQEKLEQLNLTFVTMEQRGAMMLTDEMIAVGGNLLHNENVNINESLSALSDAVVVLPSYLDRLQAGHEDLPILLLPTLNELRASYDESMLSEGTLFAPDLNVFIEELARDPESPVSIAEWNTFAQRMRKQYQTALVHWLREQSNPDHLKPLRQVCETLHERLHRPSLRRMWWIAMNVVSGLQESMIDNDLPLRRMFARLDLCLKTMVEGGQDGPVEDSITALSRALLFHVAQARKGYLPVDQMRDMFRIDEIIPDRDALLRAKGAVTGRDAQLFHSIGMAIREEMTSIKDSLDMELRTGQIDSEARADIVSSLIQLSDTLYMLELPVPASALQGLLPALELTREVENFELDSPLLALAQQLLEVEGVLDKHIQLLGEPLEEGESESNIALSSHEQRHIIARMLDEAVTSLHTAQEAIRDRLENEGEADYATPLQEISGAMYVAGQMEVSKLTDKLGRAFHACLMGKGSKQEEPGVSLMLLADAVAALELYLTGCRDEQANSLKFLDIMQDRLEGLPEASADGEMVHRTVVRLPQRPAPGTSKQDEPKPPSQESAAEEQGDRLPPAIDSSMQDIFLEEFEAVKADLAESSSAWLEDVSQRRPLEDIRRGFHTLKGSGRMVGAKELGDFSWRIENLLNRVLENKVETSPTVSRMLTLAIGALPDLKTRMLQQPSDLTVTAIQRFTDSARQLARGENIDLESLESLLPEALRNFTPGPVTTVDDQPPSTGHAADDDSDTPVAEESAAEPAPEPEEPGLDPTLVQLMIGEIRQYLDTLESYVSGVESGSTEKANIDQCPRGSFTGRKPGTRPHWE